MVRNFFVLIIWPSCLPYNDKIAKEKFYENGNISMWGCENSVIVLWGSSTVNLKYNKLTFLFCFTGLGLWGPGVRVTCGGDPLILLTVHTATQLSHQSSYKWYENFCQEFIRNFHKSKDRSPNCVAFKCQWTKWRHLLRLFQEKLDFFFSSQYYWMETRLTTFNNANGKYKWHMQMQMQMQMANTSGINNCEWRAIRNQFLEI